MNETNGTREQNGSGIEPVTGDQHDGDSNRGPARRTHRFMPIDRLNVFSDAVFATITTFMVVPIKEEVEHYDATKDLWSSLTADWYRFLIFVISFLIVSTLWQDHVWALQRVEHVGDIGLILNVVLLLVASVIPFLAALMGDFYRYALTAQLFGGCILAISVVQGIMIVLAFRKGKMLSEELADGNAKKWMQVEFLSSACSRIVLSAFAIGIAKANVPTSFTLMVLVMFTDWFFIIAVGIYRSRKDDSFSTGLRQYYFRRFILEDVDMDRTQTFTDGVFIIVSTLIILDITADSLVPIDEKISEDALHEALGEKKDILLAYLSTFLTIGMIWYINYSMFYYLQRLSRLLLLLNRLTLLFISVVPLGFQLVSVFGAENAGRNENAAVQFHCVLVFCASVSQLLFWMAGHWKRHKHFSPSLQSLHRYRIVCLLLVYPVTSTILFCAAFSKSVFHSSIIHAVELSVPVLFLLIKLIFEVIIHKRRGRGVSRENIAMDNGSTPQVNNTATMLWHANGEEQQ